MPMLEVNATSLYYEDTGPGSTGETIAFSHGLLWDTTLFVAQIAALRSRYRCIAWDHRGQGRSAADQRHCIGIELVWQDAVALLERLGGGPVHLVGLSMGGFVAMRVAARRPDLVRSLILLETSADPEPTENVARYRLLSAVTRAFGPKIVATMTRRRDAWRAVNGVIDRAGVYAELGRIKAPTLVLVGDEDVATPRPKAERITAAIAGAQLEIIARAGHSSPVEEPAAVTAAIDRFV